MQRVKIVVLSAVILLSNCSRELSTEPEAEPEPPQFGPQGVFLPIARANWSLASYPEQFAEKPQNFDALLAMNWYNPYTQYPLQRIWPNEKLSSLTAKATNVLMIECGEHGDINFCSSGIIHWTEALQDFASRTHLEFVLVGNGILHIDIGSISEDVIPNQTLDTEDTVRNGVRNGLIDNGEDVGLDGMANSDPRAVAAGGDFWDINGNGQKEENEPFSNDDWSYDPTSAKQSIDYSRINGTEGNVQDTHGRKPDTEDINQNGVLDLENHYWSYQINLSHVHDDYKKYAVYTAVKKDTGEDYGWTWYKIPLADFTTTVGSPSPEDVEFVRLWLTDSSTPAFVSFYSFVFTKEENQALQEEGAARWY